MPAPRLDELRRVDGIQALAILVETYGLDTITRWLRHIASLQGQHPDNLIHFSGSRPRQEQSPS